MDIIMHISSSNRKYCCIAVQSWIEFNDIINKTDIEYILTVENEKDNVITRKDYYALMTLYSPRFWQRKEYDMISRYDIEHATLKKIILRLPLRLGILFKDLHDDNRFKEGTGAGYAEYILYKH